MPVLLATFLPGLALVVRRQHDIGLSGWFYLLVLIPYVGGLIFSCSAHPVAKARQQVGASATASGSSNPFRQIGERIGRQAQKYLLAMALRAEPVVEAQRAFVPVLGRQVDPADALAMQWPARNRSNPSPSPAERNSVRTNRSLRNSSRCKSMPGWAIATEARPATTPPR